MARYETVISEETVYIQKGPDLIEVGDLELVLDIVGGHAWTISYSDQEKADHPNLDTSDEGLTIDVVDAINAMTFGESFVETIEAQPATTPSEDAVPPRVGLFVGRLLENLEYGVR